MVYSLICDVLLHRCWSWYLTPYGAYMPNNEPVSQSCTNRWFHWVYVEYTCVRLWNVVYCYQGFPGVMIVWCACWTEYNTQFISNPMRIHRDRLPGILITCDWAQGGIPSHHNFPQKHSIHYCTKFHIGPNDHIASFTLQRHKRARSLLVLGILVSLVENSNSTLSRGTNCSCLYEARSPHPFC